MSARKVTLWLIRETVLARLYSTEDLQKNARNSENEVWIPKSIVEHASKTGDMHTLTLPEWFLSKNGL